MEALILLGGLTAHPIMSNLKFKNEFGNSGVILNPYTISLVGTKTFKGGFIYGTDSIGKKISGPVFSMNFNENVGVVVGSYNDNGHNRYTYKINNKKYVPVIGVSLSFDLYKSDNFSIVSSTLLSGIITTSVGVKFSF